MELQPAGDRLHVSGESALPYSFFSPRSVVIVGASDRSAWSLGSFENFERLGFEGGVHLVNRNGGMVHGKQAHTSCVEIGEPIDLALLLVNASALPDALRDVAAAGIRSAVVLAAGFGETGADGHVAQERLAALARELGVTCVGPNCLGFLNLLDRVPAWSGRMAELRAGSVAVVSQSGATAHTISAFAVEQNIGVSHVVSTGNELMLDTTSAARVLVEDERVNVVAMFMESVRNPAAFRDLAARAAELRKPLVVLKVGTSELAAEIARSHTGALVGDDRLVDAAFRQFGVIRVHSLEQLVITAGLLARTGQLAPGGLGIVSMSGGACDLVADRADAVGLRLPEFCDSTRARGAEVLSAFGTMRNPLDATGAASSNPAIFRDLVSAVAADEGISLVAAVHVLPTPERGEVIKERLRIHAPAFSGAGTPVVLLDQTIATFESGTVENLDELGIPLAVTGLDHFIQAAAHALGWSEWIRDRGGIPQNQAGPIPVEGTSRSWSEVEALDLIAAHGVPTVPYALVTTVEDARAAVETTGLPAVVKVVSGDIVHKSDIGGVALSLADADAVADAFERVVAAGAGVEGAVVDGALVAPMRSGGLEMIVGVVRDPQWGLSLVVGFGGVLVHVLDDTAVRPLPVSRADVIDMLDDLRGRPLLDGVRGGQPADVDALVNAVLSVARLAEGLGEQLESLEVNPFRVDGDMVEALDASVLWAGPTA